VQDSHKRFDDLQGKRAICFIICFINGDMFHQFRDFHAINSVLKPSQLLLLLFRKPNVVVLQLLVFLACPLQTSAKTDDRFSKERPLGIMITHWLCQFIYLVKTWQVKMKITLTSSKQEIFQISNFPLMLFGRSAHITRNVLTFLKFVDNLNRVKLQYIAKSYK